MHEKGTISPRGVYQYDANCPDCKKDYVAWLDVLYTGGGTLHKYCKKCWKNHQNYYLRGKDETQNMQMLRSDDKTKI